MGKLFGTDGVRGIANKDLTSELSYKIGLAVAEILVSSAKKNLCENDNNRKKTGTYERPKAIIGKDTRISGDMIECAMSAGLCAGGCDVSLVGVVPTPAVAFLVREYNYNAGIMISASHNTSEYNGIKIFNNQGFKFSDEAENYIEKIIETDKEVAVCTGADIGRVTRDERMVQKYTDHVINIYEHNENESKKLKILIDCANGSASATAHEIFRKQGFVNCTILHANPSGTNINDKCGSTHMEILREEVKKCGYDVGVAFDGDADRCLLVDENGEDINGDKIICLIADEMKEEGKLKNNTIVVTKLSNIGLHKFAERNGISVEVTDVGDRYVLENMLEHELVLGGEQSGHIILTDYATTGDGQMTAVMVTNIIEKRRKKASEIFSIVKMYPQVEVNVKVSPELKSVLATDKDVLAVVQKVETALNGNGRILLRPSGTEPVVRIMIEGENKEEISKFAADVERAIKSKM